MKSNFKLLIATPMYNAEKYVYRLAKSMRSETRDESITWLVRLDGCTDDTEGALWNACNMYNINLILHIDDNNRGLTYGRNFLSDQFVNNPNLKEFTHMVFIDADDYFNTGWHDTIMYWLNKVSTLYPDEKTPYLCFKYWDDRKHRDECQIYTKLNTKWKHHAALCQYPDGGVDLLHVIPREYLIEVKEWDGNYYHVAKNEKWTPDTINFMAYTDYPASFIGDIVASLGTNYGNMSDTYYDNVVTKYAKGQVDEAMMFMDIYGSDSHNLGMDWMRVPGFRWRWYLKCILRMIKNGTLVFSDKSWDEYTQPSEVTESKSRINW